jgi:hypothetical protein
MNRVFWLTVALIVSSSSKADSRPLVLSKTLGVCFRGDAATTVTRRGSVDAATGIVFSPASGTEVDFLLDAHPDRRRFDKIKLTGISGPIGPVKRLYYSDGRRAFLVEKRRPDWPPVYMFFRYEQKNERQQKAALKIARSLFACSAAGVPNP